MAGLPPRRGKRSSAFWLLVCVLGANPPASSAGAAEPVAVSAPQQPPAAIAAARERIASLRAEIARHDALYFQQAAPEISDFDYDQLKLELAGLERNFPELAGPATAAAIGDDRTGRFPLRRHREPMRSLDKTYAETGVREFHRGLAAQLGATELECVVEPKVDGVAINVTYERGAFVSAVTRGNGREGDDVTANVHAIAALPHELRAIAPDGSTTALPDLIELRGEIFLPLAMFERINRERLAVGEPPFAHPRNLAAGSLQRLDPQEVAERGLALVIHGWGACEPAALAPRTQHEFQQRLAAWGLPALDRQWRARGADEIWRAVQACRQARAQLAYAIDGAVVKLDPVAQQQLVGATDAAPHWAIAFKFPPERIETRLRAITLQVGRTGLITPVAELEPVNISGSTVERATLHNRATIERLDLRIGDFVVLEKAGEIIPAIVAVNTARRAPEAPPFAFPTVCPGCGSELAQANGEAAMRCRNRACPAQVRRRLEHFASAAGVQIDGLGPATIDALVARGFVQDVPDIYRLGRGDLLAPGRGAEKTADRLLAAIEQSKRAELWRFIHGLGITDVGAVTARQLARDFAGLDALANADFSDPQVQQRLDASGIGPATVRALAAHFSEERNRAVCAELLALGVQPAVDSPRPNAQLAGVVFVLTGKLSRFTRDEARTRIEAAGGIVREQVSGKVDYVVAGAAPGEKLEQARALGVTVIDEAELVRLLGESAAAAGPP